MESEGFKLPTVKDNCKSVWAQFSILAPTKNIRDNIVTYLKENNVNVAIFYPSPLHTQECFKYLKYKIGSLEVTEDVCDRIFNLPCYDELTILEKNYIINLILKFCKKKPIIFDNFNNDKITIIINSYNPKKNELLISINSCLGQIDVDVYLIVSTIEDDITIDIVKKLNNPKIKLVVSLKSEHPGKGPKGIYFQLNKALQQVKTMYVSYFSSNDIMKKTKSINEITKIKKENSIFCFSSYDSFYIKDNVCYKKVPFLFKKEDMTLKGLFITNFINDCATIDLSKIKKPIVFNYKKYENVCFYKLWLSLITNNGIECMSYNDKVEWNYMRDTETSQSLLKNKHEYKHEILLKKIILWEFIDF